MRRMRQAIVIGTLALPVAVLALAGYYFFGWTVLWLSLWVALTSVYSILFQRKFRLWMDADALQLRRGFLGREELVLKWNMIQSVVMQQSIYQEGRELATVVLYTAGGQVKIPYIPVSAARKIINYALYKVESFHVQ